MRAPGATRRLARLLAMLAVAPMAAGAGARAVAPAAPAAAPAAPAAALAAPAAPAAPASPAAPLPPGAPEPVRIQFGPGASSASLPIQFPSASGPGQTTLRYVVAGRAGQELEVSVSVPARDSDLALAVTCPGDGHTAIGRSGKLSGAVTLPQTGDYLVTIREHDAGDVPPGVLTVSVTGAPRMIAARPYTGTYYRGDDSGASADVRETGSGNVQFSLIAFPGAIKSSGSPNRRAVRGIAQLHDGAGVFEQGGCHLDLRFGASGSGTLHVEESGDCAFGPNVTARGDYRRTSLCAAPEPLQ